MKLNSYAFLLLGIIFCLGAAACRADAQVAPSPACLAPLKADDANPQPRDVNFTVAADKKSVVALVCVVSNRDRLATLGVSFGAFDTTGKLVGLNGQALGAAGPINDPTPNHPKIVSLSATTIPINLAPAEQLSTTALVQIQWAPCTNPPPEKCTPGALQSDTFLREAAPKTSNR